MMRIFVPLSLGLVTACTGQSESPTIDIYACDETSEGWDVVSEDTFLDLGASDALALIPSEVDVAWFWEDQTDTQVALQITLAETTLRRVTSQHAFDNEETTLDVALPCENRIDIEGNVSMISEDGRLNESLLMTFSIGGFDNSRVHARVNVDNSELQGDLDLSAFIDLSDWDDVNLEAELSFDTAQLSEMSLYAVGEHTDTQAVTVQLIPLGNAVPELDF